MIYRTNSFEINSANALACFYYTTNHSKFQVIFVHFRYFSSLFYIKSDNCRQKYVFSLSNSQHTQKLERENKAIISIPPCFFLSNHHISYLTILRYSFPSHSTKSFANCSASAKLSSSISNPTAAVKLSISSCPFSSAKIRIKKALTENFITFFVNPGDIFVWRNSHIKILVSHLINLLKASFEDHHLRQIPRPSLHQNTVRKPTFQEPPSDSLYPYRSPHIPAL